MSTVKVKTVFPLAVHMGVYIQAGEKLKISQHAPLHQCCEGGPVCDRRRKSFAKPFNLTLAVVFLTSDFYLLTHVKRLEISQKVVLSP